jgi:hypothetical protein
MKKRGPAYERGRRGLAPGDPPPFTWGRTGGGVDERPTKKAPVGEDRGGVEDELPRMKKSPGNVLLSHQVALTVPSALEGLTAVFGMGTGVAPPPRSPG